MQGETQPPLPSNDKEPREVEKVLSESALAAALHAFFSSIGLILFQLLVYFKILNEDFSFYLTPFVPPVATIFAFFFFKFYKRTAQNKIRFLILKNINRKYKIIDKEIDKDLARIRSRLKKVNDEKEKESLLKRKNFLFQEKENNLKLKVEELRNTELVFKTLHD